MTDLSENEATEINVQTCRATVRWWKSQVEMLEIELSQAKLALTRAKLMLELELQDVVRRKTKLDHELQTLLRARAQLEQELKGEDDEEAPHIRPNIHRTE